LDMIEAALADDRITSLEMLRETIRPAIMVVPRAEPDPGRLRHIRSWLDAVAASWAASPAPDDLEDDDLEDDDLSPGGGFTVTLT
jgi:hypothetical protein